MDQEAQTRVVLATFKAFPDAQPPVKAERGGSAILVQTDAYTFMVETDRPSPDERAAALLYVFPQFPLKMNRANEKKLKKMNQNFFNSKGFVLAVLPDQGGLWDSMLMYELDGSEDINEIKRIYDQFLMLSVFAFQGIGELM